MNNGFDESVSFSSRLWIFFSASVVLCNYYYLYFFDFNQGSADVGIFFSALKVLGTALICSSLLSLKLRTKVNIETLILFIFMIIAFSIYCLKTALIGFSDIMFINTMICSIPFLILKPNPNLGRIRLFFEYSTFIIMIQIVIDSIIYTSGNSIWDNRAFIGGLGNPSSFGLTCNILISYILLQRKRSLSSAISYFTLAAGVYMTSSILALLTLGIITSIWLLRGITLRKFTFGVIIFLAAAFAGKDLMSKHLEYKLNSIINMASESNSSQSASISIRTQIHREYAENFENSPVDAIFTGFDKRSYMNYDSQLLTYASSFGLLTTSIFLLGFAFLYVRARRETNLLFASTTILIFAMTFLTNRIMDYYPMPIFLFIILSLISEIVARRRNDSYSSSVIDDHRKTVSCTAEDHSQPT